VGANFVAMTERQRDAINKDEGRFERAILGLLLDPESRSPWSVDEVLRELEDARVEAIDGLDSLQRAGLIHRCGNFVFATRAAVRFDQIEMA
jgi:hypothetical protein